MTKTIATFLIICLSYTLFGQEMNCDSTLTFAFIKNGKGDQMIMNRYKIVVKNNNGEKLELLPIPISYEENDRLIVDHDAGYIKSQDFWCDSLTVMTYKYKSFEVSFKSEPLCKFEGMDFGVYIYHFTNFRQLKRFKKAKRAIVHPINTYKLGKDDFPLTLVALDTEEFTLELEIINDAYSHK